MEELVLCCEDHAEGIFTGIYQAYARKQGLERTHLKIGESSQGRLFCRYLKVNTETEEAIKVDRTLRRELGGEVHQILWHALASCEEEKAEAIYQTVVLGLTGRNGRKRAGCRVMEQMADLYVNQVSRMERNVTREIQHLYGFLRFAQLEDGTLYAKIGPKNQILPFLMEHFADRFRPENFVIFDERHQVYGLHPAGKQWFLASGGKWMQEETLRYSSQEKQIQELFTYFCHKIAIKERKNEALQLQMLPLRFQKYMVEFEAQP